MTISMHTTRLTLKPVLTRDLNWFHDLNIRPEVYKYLWDGVAISRDTAGEIAAQNQVQMSGKQYGLWKAEHGQTPVGYYGLWHFFDEQQPQLIYVTDPDHFGRGFAKEAAKSILDYAFNKVGFDFIDASTDKVNVGSQRVALALGFDLRIEKVENGKPTLFFRKTRMG